METLWRMTLWRKTLLLCMTLAVPNGARATQRKEIRTTSEARKEALTKAAVDYLCVLAQTKKGFPSLKGALHSGGGLKTTPYQGGISLLARPETAGPSVGLNIKVQPHDSRAIWSTLGKALAATVRPGSRNVPAHCRGTMDKLLAATINLLFGKDYKPDQIVKMVRISKKPAPFADCTVVDLGPKDASMSCNVILQTSVFDH
jgi:hypothetical protein